MSWTYSTALIFVVVVTQQIILQKRVYISTIDHHHTTHTLTARGMATTHSIDAPSNAACVSCDSLSFPSFLARVRRSGLIIARSLKKETLIHIAEQALVLEEKVATGCVMIQAVTLLVYFHKQNGINPLEWTSAATDFGTFNHSLPIVGRRGVWDSCVLTRATASLSSHS